MPKGVTHGLSYEPLYQVWVNMLNRCNNPQHQAYAKYGARSITVCPEWSELHAFILWAESNGYTPGLTLDREKNDQGYTTLTFEKPQPKVEGYSSSLASFEFNPDGSFAVVGVWE